jgi:hypothetical protein
MLLLMQSIGIVHNAVFDLCIRYGPKTRNRARVSWVLNWDDNHQTVNPFQFVLIVLARWMNQRQQNVIEYAGGDRATSLEGSIRLQRLFQQCVDSQR